MDMSHVFNKNSVTLDTGQIDPLVDDLIRIRVLGLVPGTQVTIHTTLKEKERSFGSAGCFIADDNGVVDVSQQPSIQGTYTGVHQMGLFWSMIPAPFEPSWLRLFKRDATEPLVTTITVYEGKIIFEDFYSKQHEPLVYKTINRWYMGKGVRKIEVRQANLRGSVFVPPGDGPFAAVIDMFGTVGALAEFRAALFASRGFVAYALPYFGQEGLPDILPDVEFQYFMDAVDWLSSQPYVSKSGIGVIGVSKGGEIALLMAYYSPKIKAVVSINGAPFLTGYPMPYQGDYVGLSGIELDNINITHEGKSYRDVYVCESKDYIPLYAKDKHVLLIVGEDDMTVNPQYLKSFYKSYPSDRRHLIEFCMYSGAGHLIEPPYSPLSRSTRRYVKSIMSLPDPEFVLWGGEPVQHAAAQEHSWSKILDFFRTKLQQRSVSSNL